MRKLLSEFRAFHTANPHVYELFKKYTFEAIAAGREHLGSRMVTERIRWYTTVETSDVEYKLNNNHNAYYSRKFMFDYPEHQGFFRTRNARGDDGDIFDPRVDDDLDPCDDPFDPFH